MPKPPPLTDNQKKILRELEPQLRACVLIGDLDTAKVIAAKIRQLLIPTGHKARWMQNKNWLAECAIESGNIAFADLQLKDVRKNMSDSTRIHIEATALLSLCYLRTKRINDALILIKSVISRVNSIRSDRRRRQFHKRFVTRMEEECILAGLIGADNQKLDVDEIQEEAIALQRLDEHSLMLHLGGTIPSNSVRLLEGVRTQALKQLPPVDRKCLPTTEEVKKPKEFSKRAKAALKHVVWSALCDPNDEIYQAWSKNLEIVYNKKLIAGAIIASLTEWNILIPALAIAVLALAFKMGVKIFCRTFAPRSIMISRSDKSN